MPPSLVQKAIFNGASTPTSLTFAVTLPQPVKPGNILAGYVFWGQAVEADFVSITDGLGNLYITVDHTLFNADPVRSFWAGNIKGGNCTITVTLNTARAFESILVHEITGCNYLDQHALNTQTNVTGGTDVITSGLVTPRYNGEYIFGAMAVHNTVAETITAGTGFTIENLAAGDATHGPFASEQLIQTNAAAVAAKFSETGTEIVSCVVMTFANLTGQSKVVSQAINRAASF